MPCEIIWLSGATKDVARLRDFIKSENPRAALRAAKRIVEGVAILQENPEAGVPVESLMDFRDLTLTFGAGECIIRYRKEKTNRVVIVRVRHSKEDAFQL